MIFILNCIKTNHHFRMIYII